jgi:hypothetical protein
MDFLIKVDLETSVFIDSGCHEEGDGEEGRREKTKEEWGLGLGEGIMEDGIKMRKRWNIYWEKGNIVMEEE